MPLSDEVPTSVDSRRLQSRNDTSAFIPVPFPSDLAFKYRIIKLGRWTSIVPRQGGKSINNDEPHGSVEDSEASATADQMTAEKETVISKFDFSHHRRIKVGVPSNERSHWMSDSSPAIGATYQHCLFEAPQESLTSALTTQLGDLRSTKYANSNSIPGVLKLLAKDSTDFHIAFSNRTLVYRFVPSPLEQNPLRNAGDWPSLALKFSPFRGNDGLVRVKLRDVSLSTNPRRHGVLLPDRATDLDFFQCRKSKLFYPLEIDEIRQFVDAVCANIESGERLRAPPTLTLDIPRYLIPTYSEQATGTRKFTYLFESVTHKHFVHMAFEGQSVVYSTSQQGPLGQNGSTLRLFPTGLGVKGAGHRFVDTAFKLADRITEAASDPNPIGLRPKVDTRGNTIFKSIDIGRGSSKTDEVKTSVSEGHVDESSPVDEPSGVIDPEVALTTTNDVSTPENEVSTGKSSVVDEP